MTHMTPVSLTFEVHQPIRLWKHGPNLNEKKLHNRYFNSSFTKEVFDKVASKCYYPATRTLLHAVDALKSEKKQFKVAFSITGTWIEQAEKWHPELLDLFASFPKKNVEFLGETYYHSLSSLFGIDRTEFTEQVEQQREAINSLFGQKPRVMVNTELMYNNQIAKVAEDLKFKGIFTEGVPHMLGWRSPNYVYSPPENNASKIKILLRNRRLTDDVGYRFSARGWDNWPLNAEKYTSWLAGASGDCINLFMDYETIGEHHWEDTGIFWFFKALPHKVNDYEHLKFSLPSEILAKCKPVGTFDVFEYDTVSWADLEMDTSAWLGNRMQVICYNELLRLEEDVKKLNDKDVLRVWRLLQTSDHLHNICTKGWGDGNVHHYFSYFDTPHQGFETLTEALHDLKREIQKRMLKKR